MNTFKANGHQNTLRLKAAAVLQCAIYGRPGKTSSLFVLRMHMGNVTRFVCGLESVEHVQSLELALPSFHFNSFHFVLELLMFIFVNRQKIVVRQIGTVHVEHQTEHQNSQEQHFIGKQLGPATESLPMLMLQQR